MTPTRPTIRSLAIVATAALLTACGLHGKPKVERKQTASSTPAAASNIGNAASTAGDTSLMASDVVAPGIVEPWGDKVALAPQEPGWIAHIVVKEGEAVRAGQLLATLDDASQRRSVEMARADLAEAEAVQARMAHGATVEELRQAEAELAAAVARSNFARASAARVNRLHRDSLVADNEAERVAADALAQEAMAERASARLEELKRGARAEDRIAVRARTEAARARLQLAIAGLNRRRITAPNAGTVLLSRFHAGEFYDVSAGPLFILGDMTRLQVRLEVDEIDAHDVQAGAPSTLFSDGGQALARGTIVRLAPQMGRRSLPLESPTARADVRIREVFVEVHSTSRLVPGQRVWGRTARNTRNST